MIEPRSRARQTVDYPEPSLLPLAHVQAERERLWALGPEGVRTYYANLRGNPELGKATYLTTGALIDLIIWIEATPQAHPRLVGVSSARRPGRRYHNRRALGGP